MIRRKNHDSLLALLGMTALGVYVLACRPSFSPDGTKVVFPVLNEKARLASVAVFDLQGKSLETLLVSPGVEGDSLGYSAQWLPDGERVVINTISAILVLAPDQGTPVRFLPLKTNLDLDSLVIPSPVIGRYQFLAGDSWLMRVDLESGDTLQSVALRKLCLTGHRDSLFYVRETDQGDEKGYEVGRVNPEDLVQSPIMTIDPGDADDLNPFLAPTRDERRLALTGQYQDAPRILLYLDGKREKILPTGAAPKTMTIGNPEWNHDESILYVAYAKELDRDHGCGYGVLEVPVDGGPVRETGLFSARCSDSMPLQFQVSLSFDGMTAAASSLCLTDDSIRPEDRALYLIDLSSPERRVTRIAVPWPPATSRGK